MKPIIVYFISGDFSGDHVEVMESKLGKIYPDRETNVFFVESEEEKYKMLNTYNIEELDPYLGDTLWEAIEENDNGDSI